MIGVFDSGEGGLAALDEIKRLSPSADIVFHADRKNSPYGTKTKTELVSLVKRDIELLVDSGAKSILIACCTASTVYPMLSENEKKICLPIIFPTAKAAAETTKTKKIGIICTDATARSGAFESAIFDIDPRIKTKTVPLKELVTLVENGVRDGLHTPRDAARISKMLAPIADFEPDVLILGCTHFSRVSSIISSRLKKTKIVDSAKIGAREILELSPRQGTGKMIYV